MSWLSRLRNAIDPAALEEDLEEELRFHLESRTEELMARGFPREEAAREARRRLGSPLRHRETSRDVKLLSRLEALLSDARYGWRKLRREGRSTVTVLLSLGLALGACTAAFSLLNALVLRPLAVADPDRLVYLSYTSVGAGGSSEREGFSYPLFERLRERARPRVRLFGMSYQDNSPMVVDGAPAEREWVQAQWISGDAFEALGLRPALGRLLDSDDDRRPGQHPVAVLSFEYWKRRFAASQSVLGRWLMIGTTSYQVVGVLGSGFPGAEPGVRTDVWLPNMMWNEGILANPTWSWFRIWGRLEPGATPEQVRAVLQPTVTAFRGELAASFPADAPAAAIESFVRAPLSVHSAANGPSELRERYQTPLLVVAGVAVAVLLIAGSNVANLLLARGAAREPEMALRSSLGAVRGRLVQQLMVESSLLAAGACLLGVLLATALAPLAVSLLSPADDPVWLDLRPDLRVVAFLAALATLTTVTFSLAPALRTSGVSPSRTLRRGGDRQSSSRGILRPLLAVQVAFCFLVLFVAGELLLSFRRLSTVDLGFAAENLLIAKIEGPRRKEAGSSSRWSQLLDGIRTLPEVEQASHSAWGLLAGPAWSSGVRIPGRRLDTSEPFFLRVSTGFFATMGIPLRDGRDFDSRDAEPGQPRAVVVVNEAFARRYFPDGSALGRTFLRLEDARQEVPQEIVGVVGNALYRDLREPAPPTVYLLHHPDGGATLEVRVRRDAARVSLDLPRRIAGLDPAFRVNAVVPQATLVGNSMLRERLLALISIVLAAGALLLVGVGLFGVMSYSVERRTKEIGIRMALGARSAVVLRLVLGEIALVVTLGILVGVVAGRLAVRALAALLFGVQPTDPWSLGLPLIALLLASTLAVLPTVRRLARVDPLIALRCD